MKKGKLVRVHLGGGRYVKMYEADAVAQGLIPDPKARPKPEDKMRRPEGNKAATGALRQSDEPEPEPPAPPPVMADFESIEGIGPASARALAAHGITTFDALLAAADLSFLTPQAQEAVEAWRAGGE